MTTLNALRAKRNEILAIARRHGAHNLRVFGSVAREADTPASDIDLLVDFEAERSLYDLVALQADMESFLARRTDIVTAASLNNHLRDRILQEASPL